MFVNSAIQCSVNGTWKDLCIHAFVFQSLMVEPADPFSTISNVCKWNSIAKLFSWVSSSSTGKLQLTFDQTEVEEQGSFPI
jgi:hypothetical protein